MDNDVGSTTNRHRRATDKQSDEIDDLIRKEPDEKTRLILIILNNINRNLVANTALTSEIADKQEVYTEAFSKHIKEHDAMSNRGRGMLRVIGWVLAIAQIVFGYLWVVATGSISHIQDDLDKNNLEHVRIDDRLKVLEKERGLP